MTKKISVTFYECWGENASGPKREEKQINYLDSYGCTQLIEQMCEQKGAALNRNDIVNAIENGKTELQNLYDVIVRLYTNLERDFELFEEEYMDPYPELESYFWQDIADGLYSPDVTIDQLIETYKKENPKKWEEWKESIADENERNRGIFFTETYQQYIRWINTEHLDDYSFIAERLGFDIGVVYEKIDEYYMDIAVEVVEKE